jgi:hypothetical protein
LKNDVPVLTPSTSSRALDFLCLAIDQPADHIFRMEHSADVVGEYEGAPLTWCRANAANVD